MDFLRDAFLLIPEIFLGITFVFLLFSEITYTGEKIRLVFLTSILGLLSAGIQCFIVSGTSPQIAIHGTMVVDGLSFYFRLFFITAALLAVVSVRYSKEIRKNHQSEYVLLIIGATLALCLVSSSVNLIVSFICLQLVNTIGYYIAGLNKRSSLSSEASIKYWVFSVVSGGLMAYGFAILFAQTHGINIPEIHRELAENFKYSAAISIAFGFIFLGLSFQIASFPMHFWLLDFAEGGPTPAAGFMANAGRAAGVVVSIRLILGIFANPTETRTLWQHLPGLNWPLLLAWVAGVTMLFGSFMAIRQDSAKRLLACLLVAESGLFWSGMLVLDSLGIAAILFNLVIQLFAVFGAFFILSFLVDTVGSDKMSDLRGALKRATPESILLILFMICVVGIPPLSGFIGKFTIIGATLRRQWAPLAAIAILSIAVSTVSVVRLAYSLAGDYKDFKGPAIVKNSARTTFLIMMFIPLLIAGVFAQNILGWAVRTAERILW